MQKYLPRLVSVVLVRSGEGVSQNFAVWGPKNNFWRKFRVISYDRYGRANVYRNVSSFLDL